MKAWLGKRKFEATALAFVLMLVPPVPLYFTAQAGQDALSLVLLGLIVAGNLLAMLIP